MAKKELLSKLNLKDYNNELEIILEKKDFSSQVKNLLLSMFYKLEIGYKDYAMAKREVLSKEAFMESIMHMIKTKCNHIELVKPSENEKKFEVFPEEEKMICYQNEAAILHGILHIGQKEFWVSDKVLEKAIQEVLIAGYELEVKELLTNFDGWSWNNNFDEEDQIDTFLLYQNIKMIMGMNFLYEWKRERRRERDFLKELKKTSEEFWRAFCQYALMKSAKQEAGNQYIEEELEKLKQQLSKMEDKNQFLKEIYEQKRIASEQIKRLDKILNDNDLLKEEFLSKNAQLEQEKKIFSLSDLEEILQKERNQCMEQMQECNTILEPKNYLEKMKVLKEKIELVESVERREVTNEKLQRKLMEIQEIVLALLKQKVANTVTKKEVIELIYQYRYYLYLPVFNGKEIIKEIPELKELLEDTAKKIITKACKLKALIIINQDIKYNFQIMLKILDTKMIHLEDIYVNFSKAEEEIQIEVYDGEILDRTETISKEKEKDFAIKFNRKIKLFA